MDDALGFPFTWDVPATAGPKGGGATQDYTSAPDPDLVFNIFLRGKRNEVSKKFEIPSPARSRLSRFPPTGYWAARESREAHVRKQGRTVEDCFDLCSDYLFFDDLV